MSDMRRPQLPPPAYAHRSCNQRRFIVGAVLSLSVVILVGVAVWYQWLAIPASIQPRSDMRSENETITVKINGRDATPHEARAFKDFGRKLLSDALPKAIDEAFNEFQRKLDISDPIEADLLSESFVQEKWDGDSLRSVFLIRPAPDTTEPRSIVVSSAGKPIFRFTRAAAPIERPLAIVTLTFKKDGHLAQMEKFLVHIDGKWTQYRPSESNESIGKGSR